MTTLSPATIGDDSPPGAGTFHLTFLSGPSSTGGFWPSATPDPFGPRNWGHASALSAPSPEAANTASATEAIIPFMSSPPRVVPGRSPEPTGRCAPVPLGSGDLLERQDHTPL